MILHVGYLLLLLLSNRLVYYHNKFKETYCGKGWRRGAGCTCAIVFSVCQEVLCGGDQAKGAGMLGYSCG